MPSSKKEVVYDPLTFEFRTLNADEVTVFAPIREDVQSVWLYDKQHQLNQQHTGAGASKLTAG